MPELNRRTYIAGIGATIAAGTGIASFSQRGAASTANITSSPASVTNDRGDVSEVTVDPAFSVTWSGLDDAVGKVFYLVEAKVGDGDWSPIFRATPWLEAAGIGTSGTYEISPTLSQAMNQDGRFSDGTGPDYSASPLVVADEQGKPDYSSIDFSTIGGVTLESYLDGTSVSGADDYPGSHEDGGFQNNYWDVDAGYYGAAADTSSLDNGDDGSSKTTAVSVRYTFELQRPNLSQLKYRVDMSKYKDGSYNWDDLTDAQKKAFAASEIDGLEESDIDVGNSTIVMNGEDGFPGFAEPAGISYADLQANESHPGIIVETTAFDVTVKNEAAGTSATGSSGSDAN